MMQLRRYLWVMSFFLGLWLTACAGGSGSSGFDSFPSSENAAIDQALSEQQCVSFRGLSICPADTLAAPPTPSATSTPEPSRTPTSVVIGPVATPTPSALQTRLPTASATPTYTPTATPPGHEPSAPRVDTGINDGAIPCGVVDASNTCVFLVPFAPEGFPEGTVFRLAVRRVSPEGAWTIGPDLSASGAPDAPTFDAPVAVGAPEGQVDAPLRVQLAVLAYAAPPASGPGEVQALADSGADYAFVTAVLTLQPTL